MIATVDVSTAALIAPFVFAAVVGFMFCVTGGTRK